MKKQMTVRKTVLAALFLAIGLILPFITMQIPAVGKMLCPMHIPVLLCGYILGGPYGLIVGFITPLLRSVTFGMPVMLPNAICMAFELATYGLVSGMGTCISNCLCINGKRIYMEIILYGWICECNPWNCDTAYLNTCSCKSFICSGSCKACL